ncbi:uncharacterized protein EI97DRAFT_202483 [Westerdykella ornata]|uniref:Uncharacterized protein n=1 Tax=Westerdykella ornata TaxID=318751 RepID=A0A6A6J7V3_WESOR|nr:uncharacterized protein EI97DRAFT_202483 [Westerdykella ornata]KAF2272660.1 hypothetical protein EI97DRAFT_202483 [Westerdykella ornata]
MSTTCPYVIVGDAPPFILACPARQKPRSVHKLPPSSPIHPTSHLLNTSHPPSTTPALTDTLKHHRPLHTQIAQNYLVSQPNRRYL